MSLLAKALEKHILNSPVSQTKLPEKCTGGKMLISCRMSKR